MTSCLSQLMARMRGGGLSRPRVFLCPLEPDVAGQGGDVLGPSHSQLGVLEHHSAREDQALPAGGRRERDPDSRRRRDGEDAADVTDTELRRHDLHRVVGGVDLLDLDEHLLGRHEGRQSLQVRRDRDHSAIRQRRIGDRAREGGQGGLGREDVVEGLRDRHLRTSRGDEGPRDREADVLPEGVLQHVEHERVGLDARDQPATTGLRRDGLRAVRGAEDPVDLPSDDRRDGLTGGPALRRAGDGDGGVRGAGDEREIHGEPRGVRVGGRSVERRPATGALASAPGGADTEGEGSDRRQQKAPSGLLLAVHVGFLALAASRLRTCLGFFPVEPGLRWCAQEVPGTTPGIDRED